MTSLAIYLFLLASSPILVLMIHAAAVQILRRDESTSPQLIVGFSILIGYGIVAFPAWIFYLRYLSSIEEFFGAIFYGFIVYFCLSYAYFHFFNISETARRFQILVLLSKSRKVDRRDIAVRYSASDMIKTRLERLVQSGQLTLKNNRYFLKRRMLYSVAKILMMWAILLKFLERDGK